MSGQNRKDFDDRLAELNNWQVEQQKKLKAFREAQKKLLDFEHQNVLNGLITQNFCQEFIKSNNEVSNTAFKEIETVDSLDVKNFKSKDINGDFQLKFPQIKLNEPKLSLFNMQNYPCTTNNFCGKLMENSEKTGANGPRKFLKRGEGLARFRMTLDDFKIPPKIYREKRIKTYLNNKPELKMNRNVKPLKSNIKCNRKQTHKITTKSAHLPIKIYVPEYKTKQGNSSRGSEIKATSQISKKVIQVSPKPIENLCLKPHNIATEWYTAMKEKEKVDSKDENIEAKNNSVLESDTENKRELKIFEILEKKVDETSFCSTSSFVDKLMEQSLSSTPTKSFANGKELGSSYAQGLKSLCSKFLEEEQVKKFEESDKIPLDEKVISESEDESSGVKSITPEIINEEETDKDIHEDLIIQSLEKEPQILYEVTEEPEPEPHKVNKTLLQEYIKNFKKFRCLLAENVHRIEEEQCKEPSPKTLMKEEEEKQEHLNQHEITLKLQRKGLQDNVKQLLNWECPPLRKRLPKRIMKKNKPKPKLEKSKAVSKEESGKILFNSSLLHEKLNELEREIEIFRKENKNVEKLQKECSDERMKLLKERKEFEKVMQEEKEKFEVKMAEEHKKLQKEKTVFEKYCKQVKNQPTRQEREETAKLRKEIEKLMETLTTKEARWGASQARLRNQIKNLEKENLQLKADMEKCKNKMSVKRVSLESERNLNTKIIHVINSELGKLKPTVIKNTSESVGGRNQNLSERSQRELIVKPIRRIKSAPNVKKQIEIDVCFTEGSNESDEKALGSVSTDSGIETNGSLYKNVQSLENISFKNSRSLKEVAEEKPQKESSCRSPLLGQLGECPAGRKSGESSTESAVREALFGDEMDTTSRKIAGVKNRLERLSLLGEPEGILENHPRRMVRLPSNHRDDEEEEESCCSEENEEKGNRAEMVHCPLKKSLCNKNDSFRNFYSRKNLVESKLDENGIWEKIFDDSSKEINYPNGNVKKIFPGGKIVRMNYYNGDIKETNVVEGSEKYFYAETKTWHTSYKDGLEVLEFPNGQTERRHADGSTEISFPNGCVRFCDFSGRDEWRFLDGTVIKTNECGHKILLMPNGQKEIHTKEYKRREYPDGTVKILYADGTQETRYSNGRVRLKDKGGNLVMDSGGIR